MKKTFRFVPAILLALVSLASPAAGQSFDAVGTRAAGMGGAFVAVADDGSAVYWNPAGLALGSYFSLVTDRRDGDLTPAASDHARSRSSFLVALGTPALGLSYYRLRTTSLVATGPDTVQIDTLITHNAGVTFVQSILPNVTVGSTLKIVRGVASSAAAADGDRSALLDAGDDLEGRSTNKGDIDIGVMGRIGRLKAGVTVRNISEPEFETPAADRRLVLEREARAGLALTLVPGVIVAADVDLTKPEGPFGEERIVAIGTEALLFPGATARAGFNFDTVSNGTDRDPGYSFGGSYAIKRRFLVDAQITTGSDRIEHGWGIAARFVY